MPLFATAIGVVGGSPGQVNFQAAVPAGGGGPYRIVEQVVGRVAFGRVDYLVLHLREFSPTGVSHCQNLRGKLLAGLVIRNQVAVLDTAGGATGGVTAGTRGIIPTGDMRRGVKSVVAYAVVATAAGRRAGNFSPIVAL